MRSPASTKEAHLAGINNCWNNTKPDEPVFVVVARDILAATAIAAYVRTAILRGVDPEKIRRVQDILDDVLDFQRVHGAKVPD